MLAFAAVGFTHLPTEATRREFPSPLSRALAERADFLRFTRSRLLDERGHVRAHYGTRKGERLPPPFG